jgi:protein SCO1/2
MWDNRGSSPSRPSLTDPPMAARPLRIGILVIVAFAAGLILARWLAPERAAPPTTERATVLPEPRALPALDLVDQDGQALPADFFAGHYTVVFFGFTRCPDICPTTLATLAQARRELADLPEAQRPRVLLVSVDPERDPPETLAPYVRFFDPSFLAATGSPAGIAAAAAAFGVPYARVEVPGGEYTMDHGSGLFLVGPGGGMVAYLSGPHEAGTIARDLRRVIAWQESRR